MSEAGSATVRDLLRWRLGCGVDGEDGVSDGRAESEALPIVVTGQSSAALLAETSPKQDV